MATVRDATAADVPELVELGRRMAEESPRYSRLTYAPEKLDHLFRTLIDSPDGFLVVGDRDGKLVGVMAGVVSEHWMASERFATEFGVFVDGDQRGGTTAVRMIKAFTKWAREHGAVEINLSISTGVHVDLTARFYEAIGLRQFGLMFEVPNV